MSTAKHTLLLVLTVFLAYIWLSTPSLKAYSLQAFSISSLGYFVTKKLNNGKLWHILPKNYSLEMMFITFSVLLLVGATGNIESIFYPFTYIHLFILVMSCKDKTAIIVAMATVIFHFALESSFNTLSIATIITLPMMLLFFLFAKKQYDDVKISRSIIKKEELEIDNLENQEHTLESFITAFLMPKLAILEEILSDQIDTELEEKTDRQSIKNQISLIASESEKILDKIKMDPVEEVEENVTQK